MLQILDLLGKKFKIFSVDFCRTEMLLPIWSPTQSHCWASDWFNTWVTKFTVIKIPSDCCFYPWLMFSLVLGWSTAVQDPVLLSFNPRGNVAAVWPQTAARGHIHRAASSEMGLSASFRLRSERHCPQQRKLEKGKHSRRRLAGTNWRVVSLFA